MFLFEEIDKNVQFDSLFLGSSYCVRVRQVAFLSDDRKKLSVWGIVLFTVFALEMREREAIENRRDQTCLPLFNKVFSLEHYRFPHCLMIISKYLARLSA